MTEITGPASVVEGTADTIIGVGLDLVAPVELVASNGTKTIVIAQVVTGARTAIAIPITIDSGLSSVIADALTAYKGDPLTDSQWSLKWRVATDEFGVVVSPPANDQQREVDNAEKFGGILADVKFGAQDQLISPIVTSTNTIKETMSNGKATGYFDGTERTMTETITHYVFTERGGKWRARDEIIVPFSLGQWLDGEPWVDSDAWYD